MSDLKEIRKRLGLTQGQLAAMSGLRPATISELETGRREAREGTIRALAATLGLGVSEVKVALRKSCQIEAGGEPMSELASDWAFLEGLDADLRMGLSRALIAEWTHSSTALEGNTIPSGDTLFVLTEGLTVSGKSLREHQELHGHAQALGLMAGWTRVGRPIGVTQLHELHRAVQTGTVVDAYAPVGQWKVDPNGTMAILSDGSSAWHEYAAPSDVPELMTSWRNGLIVALRERLIHPKVGGRPSVQDSYALVLQTYTDLHLGFVRIHPYADGNGRMARLLANIPVLRAGLPPLLVSAAERLTYLRLLGDFSIQCSAALPGDPLVPACKERNALQDFFESQWANTLNLVAEFHDRQAARSGG